MNERLRETDDRRKFACSFPYKRKYKTRAGSFGWKIIKISVFGEVS